MDDSDVPTTPSNPPGSEKRKEEQKELIPQSGEQQEGTPPQEGQQESPTLDIPAGQAAESSAEGDQKASAEEVLQPMPEDTIKPPDLAPPPPPQAGAAAADMLRKNHRGRIYRPVYRSTSR